MRNTTTFLLVAGLIAVAPTLVSAQDTVKVSFGGGYTAPNAEVRDHLGDGYHVNFGVQVNVTPVVGIEGLYSFNGLGQSASRSRSPARQAAPGAHRFLRDLQTGVNWRCSVEGGVGSMGVGWALLRPIRSTTAGSVRDRAEWRRVAGASCR